MSVMTPLIEESVSDYLSWEVDVPRTSGWVEVWVPCLAVV